MSLLVVAAFMSGIAYVVSTANAKRRLLKAVLIRVDLELLWYLKHKSSLQKGYRLVIAIDIIPASLANNPSYEWVFIAVTISIYG